MSPPAHLGAAFALRSDFGQSNVRRGIEVRSSFVDLCKRRVYERRMSASLTSSLGVGASSSSVFVIDDDDEARTALVNALARCGYRVRASESGVAALAELEHSDVPDVLVLDLMMPDMTGWEFRIAQRGQPRLAEVPVVVVSANRSAEALAIDADAFLSKPLDVESLKNAVERVLLAAERRKFEAQVADLDRLNSLGLLAASIAHEVNNPLAVVAGSVELASGLVADTLASGCAPRRESLKRVHELLTNASYGAERVATVVRSVATFAEPQNTHAGVVNVAEILGASIRLVTNEIRHRAKLVCKLDRQLHVLCNPAQLGQVLVSVLTHAALVIPEGDVVGHTIRVAAWRSADGRGIIEIEHSGNGIEASDLPHLFDPFFISNGVGRGSLLGLAISRRLVESWGGAISVTGGGGQGSALFRIELPSYGVLEPLAEEAHGTARAPQGEREKTLPRIRMMVIDDESLICDLVAGMLEEQMEVVAFASPREALAALRNDPSFDVILTDLMMPDLSGMDLHHTLERERPALARRMLFMTGGSFTARSQSFCARLDRKPLLKPFGVDELLEQIGKIVELRAVR